MEYAPPALLLAGATVSVISSFVESGLGGSTYDDPVDSLPMTDPLVSALTLESVRHHNSTTVTLDIIAKFFYIGAAGTWIYNTMKYKKAEKVSA